MKQGKWKKGEESDREKQTVGQIEKNNHKNSKKSDKAKMEGERKMDK